MRKQRKEEEQRIIAEMEEAMKEERAKTEETPSNIQTESYHCYRCKTLMENGVCPTCGFKMYVPMSEEQRRKIQRIGTIIGLAVFLVLFIILQLTK